MKKAELLEKWGEPTKILDHGHLQLIDVMGDDRAITEFARGSTDSQGKRRTKSGVKRLIRDLMSLRHTVPFERCEIVIHAKHPIVVARQWVRHRTAVLVEQSGRYTVLPEEFYVPSEERFAELRKEFGSSVDLIRSNMSSMAKDEKAQQRNWPVQSLSKYELHYSLHPRLSLGHQA